jgi:hypothetical protein
MRPVLITCTAAALALAGCGGGGDPVSGGSPSPSATVSSAPKELGTLKASGFGQADEYVWATAVVHNNSDYVGQTVTVSFNVLDAAGEILGTESQVESFVRPGADHVIGTQVALEPGQKAAKVEATLDVEASGTLSDQPFPDMPVSDLKVTAGMGGYPAVTFVVSNPLTVPVKDARIQVACTDASGAIIGGGSDYPELVPAGGKVKVDAHVIASGEPQDCTVFVGALDWEGAPSPTTTPTGSATPAPSAQAPTGSAEDAFEVWVGQFGKRNWKAQYKTLVNAQREVVAQSEYLACRSAEAPPKITWVKTLSVTDAGKTSIPGTKTSQESTKVTAQVKVDGLKVPVDAHMFLEDGVWKWSMTTENISNCSK